MIRILQVLGGLNYGGVSSAIMNFYRKLDKSEYHCDFTTTSAGGRWESEIKSNGGEIFLLPSRSKHPIKYYRELKRVIKNGNYDIVHSNSNSASCYLDLRAAKKAGCAIRIAHSHNSSCNVKWQHYMFKPLLSGVTTHRLACSAPAAAWMFGKNGDCKILNNGIDFDRFMYDEAAREKTRAELGNADSYVIGHVGTLCDRKNQKLLIEIMPELLKTVPNAKLVLIGSGEKRAELESLASRLDVRDRVDFLGNRSDVNELMQGFDLFCFPSVYEGLGLAYVEAAISGMDVLISESTPFVYMGGRVKAVPIDRDAWLNAVIAAHAENKPRKTFTEQERTDSGYDIKYIVAELNDFYKNACADGKTCSRVRRDESR